LVLRAGDGFDAAQQGVETAAQSTFLYGHEGEPGLFRGGYPPSHRP
jgi:hypothetical protein